MSNSAPDRLPRTVAVPMTKEDHALLAELLQLSGIKSKADVLRAAMRAYRRELLRSTPSQHRTGTEG